MSLVRLPSAGPRTTLSECRFAPGIGALPSDDLGGVPREPKMLKGHLPRVIYHQVYLYTRISPELEPLVEKLGSFPQKSRCRILYVYLSVVYCIYIYIYCILQVYLSFWRIDGNVAGKLTDLV